MGQIVETSGKKDARRERAICAARYRCWGWAKGRGTSDAWWGGRGIAGVCGGVLFLKQIGVRGVLYYMAYVEHGFGSGRGQVGGRIMTGCGILKRAAKVKWK